MFEECYSNHTVLFRNNSKEKSAQLSKHLWQLKDSNINYDIKWSIACKTCPSTAGSENYYSYSTEKLAIIKADPESLLKTHDEFIFK